MNQQDDLVTCLLVQTVDGRQEMRLVAVERNFFASNAQPINSIPQQPPVNQIAQQPQNPNGQQPYNPNGQQPYNPNGQAQIGASYIQVGQAQINNPLPASYNNPNYIPIAPYYDDRRIEVPDQRPEIPRPPSPPREIDVPTDLQLLEMRQNMVSSYNKICCFIVFFLLIHFGCFVICLLLQGSVLAFVYYLISGGIIVLSMGCACCGARNQILWLQVIHFIVLTVAFAIGVVAFAQAIKHPVLHEFQPKGSKGCFIYNTRLLDETLNNSYEECNYLKQYYPQYYTEFQSECDYQIKITEDPSILDPKDDESVDCGGIVDVQTYDTSLQKGIAAAFGFAFLLLIILFYYFIKAFKEFYNYDKGKKLRDQINQRQQINLQGQQ